MVKSTYDELVQEFGLSKGTLCQILNVLFPPLKHTFLKHLWHLIAIGCVKKERVREVIGLTTIKNIIGRENYLLRDEESYILENLEMDSAHGLPKDTNITAPELQEMIHYVRKHGHINDISPKSAMQYSQRFI